MIIECEICASYTEMDKPPLNNICPVCFHIGSLFIQEHPTNEQLEELKRMKTVPDERVSTDFDGNDMTQMFMNVDKLEEIPAVDIFDLLTEKEKARAKRKGLRSIKLDRLLDKLPISERFADWIRDIYWRC
jgi:DNA-directed RNA polymerase alpha subunit